MAATLVGVSDILMSWYLVISVTGSTIVDREAPRLFIMAVEFLSTAAKLY